MREIVGDVERLEAQQEEAARRAEDARCPQCQDRVEEWWSYCAMCGHHLAAGPSCNHWPGQTRCEVCGMGASR